MADLTTAAAEVEPGSSPVVEAGVAGEAFDAGASLYKKSSDRRWYKADADALASAGDPPTVAVSTAEKAGQRCVVQRGGTVVMGATAGVVQGQLYVVSTTAGAIAPYGDLGSGDFVSVLGVGDDSDGIALKPHGFGISKA